MWVGCELDESPARKRGVEVVQVDGEDPAYVAFVHD